jgi:hypothetical protein
MSKQMALEIPDERERPIVFSPAMVKAIIAGTKTQTRRVIHPQPERWHTVKHQPYTLIDQPEIWSPLTDNSENRKFPYGVIGDRLWVREPWCQSEAWDDIHWYRADGEIEQQIEQRFWSEWRAGKPRWLSPATMPRWISRITLEITDIRAQRVQEISPDDCFCEGIADAPELARVRFAELWDSINGEKGFGWETNCWCWCITFRKI